METSNNIYLIGCGNLGLHLGLALKEKGFKFSGVFSQKIENARKAANLLQCVAINNIYNIPENTAIIIISVPDNVLLDISEKLISPQHIVIHTSGSVEMAILKNISPKYGVFYPLQTFSTNRSISFDNMPAFVEASDNDTLNFLLEISQALNVKSNILNSEKRKILHLAAVFACNFSNFMIYNAEKILDENGLNKDLLHPLIAETFKKAIDNGAFISQTGPAIRGDKIIIDKHLKMLPDNSYSKKIYELLSNLIFETFISNK